MTLERHSSNVERESPFESTVSWQTGAIAGFVATAVMGIAIWITNVETLRVVIAGLYGFEGTALAGWVSHLAHGTLFGVVFAVVLSDPGLYRVSEWLWKTVLAGLVYGLVLAVVGAGIVMPIWLDFVGLDVPTALPFVTTSSLVWHAIYGFVLGVGYWALADRFDESPDRQS